MNTTSKSTLAIRFLLLQYQVTETSRLAQHSKLLTSEYILGIPLWSPQTKDKLHVNTILSGLPPSQGATHAMKFRTTTQKLISKFGVRSEILARTFSLARAPLS